jgi:hypothetical protein
MAAPKLTAQQKRDRDMAALMADIDKAWEQRVAQASTSNYGLGLAEGEYTAKYVFSRMSLWERITYPHTFRKSL